MIYINRLSTLPEIRAAWSLNPKLNALWLSEDQSQNVHSIMVSGPTSLDSTPDFTTHQDLKRGGEAYKQARHC